MLRRLLVLVLLLAFAIGCVDMSATYHVRSDGSGTVTEQVTVPPQLAQMMNKMGQASDSTESSGEIFSKEDAQARADTLEGLSLVSAEKITGPSGEGGKAVYAFENLNDVGYRPSPGDAMEGPNQESDDSSDPLSNIDMKFEAGSPATLTITLPRKSMDGPSFAMDGPGEDEGPPSEQEIRMARMMLSESGFRLAVSVDGEIVETNASQRSGSTVTLVDMNFTELVKDSTAFRDLIVNEEEAESPEAAIENLNAKPGLFIEPKKTVKIRFE